MRKFESVALLSEAAEDREPPNSDEHRRQAAPRGSSEPSPEKRSRGAVTCLAVDDDTGILQLLKVWLDRYQVELQTAPTGAAALKLVESGQVQILVTDLVMPGMDGIELLRRLQSLPHRPRVLGITGVAGGETLGMAFTAMGAEGFLMKPFSREQFLEALEATLGDALRLR